MILQYTIPYNIRLGFRKGFVIPERFELLLIMQKNHNKIFGEFEFDYFGGSDVANKLYATNSITNTLSYKDNC